MYTKVIDTPFTTLTRPANTTAYSANDSISDNATIGSVTPIKAASVSDTFDQPIIVEGVLVDTNDTGLAAGTQIRCHLFRTDPTLNSGVQAGDNVAWSNKRAGWMGSLVGTFIAMQDGGRARCIPEYGNYIIASPNGGGQSFWIQYQTLGAFTPSANSTTLIGTLKGFQGRV